MDPAANLAEQEALARELIALTEAATREDGSLDADAFEEVAQLADRLAELVLALGEWREAGGFDPSDSPVER